MSRQLDELSVFFLVTHHLCHINVLLFYYWQINWWWWWWWS